MRGRYFKQHRWISIRKEKRNKRIVMKNSQNSLKTVTI